LNFLWLEYPFPAYPLNHKKRHIPGRVLADGSVTLRDKDQAGTRVFTLRLPVWLMVEISDSTGFGGKMPSH
jgi:hypothetical protein